MADTATRKRRTASYIGAGVSDPVGWTRVAPVAPAPNGKAYITDGGTPLRYRLNDAGGYALRDV
ncbi:hypothetical protein HGO37_07825 [Rhizobium sp. CG4]|jgi:hypothetical protein|uniref:hypothetical protein n=1 Tax=Rhizobium sp. CG4 TaxID=2726075 RepID=UPI0020347B2B|nr:hypothetical protein [Rhizobium sp. CG4]MCM2455288.1 hypothetical protein [Rhizobium sp. CG4]